jgi:hypothetical protein
MHVVGFAIELDQFDLEFGAQRACRVCWQWVSMGSVNGAAIFGHEHPVHMRQRHSVSGGKSGLSEVGLRVWACGSVMLTTANRRRPLSRGTLLRLTRVPVSARTARRLMCGRGRCARIWGSAR